MKRGEKMLSRFTNIIQNAVEALAPQEMFFALEILKNNVGCVIPHHTLVHEKNVMVKY